jgi:hypothetical protein
MIPGNKLFNAYGLKNIGRIPGRPEYGAKTAKQKNVAPDSRKSGATP